MLFDLTRISGQRVDQVDELHVGGRHYIRSTTLFIGMGGMLAGAIAALPLRLLFGGMWPFLLVPVGMVLAVVLFDRKRSRDGELNRRRVEKLVNSLRDKDGGFALPCGEPFSPNGWTVVEQHSHPVADPDRTVTL